MLIVIYFGEKVNRYRGKKRTFYENLRQTSELDGVSSSALWGDVRFTYRDSARLTPWREFSCAEGGREDHSRP